MKDEFVIKRYSEDELLEMSESRLDYLQEHELIDDDDWQRWHDLRAQMDFMAEDFIKNELPYLQKNK